MFILILSILLSFQFDLGVNTEEKILIYGVNEIYNTELVQVVVQRRRSTALETLVVDLQDFMACFENNMVLSEDNVAQYTPFYVEGIVEKRKIKNIRMLCELGYPLMKP